MNLNSCIQNSLLRVKVIPNSKQTELIEENNQLKLYLHAVPDKNKANLELIKFFKRELGLKVEIKSGMKSREKVLRVY
ncbi:MAG TPA: DUF167 domain-containing protein [Candidatus Nanoarchaeia archaeon]|nr:DUF167 domain-containing protein [Candidatus Nanoarchaeia archaeon]